MNTAHLHLMLVHIPIVMVPLGSLLILLGLARKNTSLQDVALSMFVAAAIFGLSAFLLGEGAEDIVEEFAGVSEGAIESHENSATVALWCLIPLGIMSLVKLTTSRFGARSYAPLLPLIFACSVISSGSLAYTAQQGGMIRHPEAFGTSSGIVGESEEDDDD